MTYCLEHEITHIGLLGDIFDLMIGPHLEYYQNFQGNFDLMKKALEKGIHIYYLEGNHDFHLEGLFKLIGITEFKNFSYIKKATQIKLGNKNIIISHGDDLGGASFGYTLYSRWILRGPFIGFLATLAPYNLITAIGHYWSRKSRMSHQGRQFDETLVREKFRATAQRFWEKRKFDVLIMGHSHVKDHFILPQGAVILNSGDSAASKVFSYVDADSAKLIELA